MKKNLYIFFAISLLVSIVSCGVFGDNETKETKTADMKALKAGEFIQLENISSETNLEFSNLTDKDAYLIEVVDYGTGKGMSLANTKSGNSSGFVMSNTNIIPIPQESGNTTISGADLNLGLGSKVKITKVPFANEESPVKGFGNSGKDTTMTLQEIKDQNKLIYNYYADIHTYGWAYVGTQYYNINLAAQGPYGQFIGKDVAIVQSIEDCGNYYNPDFGFIQNGKIALNTYDEDGSVHGLFKLTPQMSHLQLYNSIIVGEEQQSVKVTLGLVEPVELSLDSDKPIPDKINVFKVPKQKENDTTEYALIFTSGSSMTYKNYSTFNGSYQKSRTIGQKSANGYLRISMVPVMLTDATSVMYIGKIPEDFIFDCNVVNTDKTGSFGSIKLVKWEDIASTVGFDTSTNNYDEVYNITNYQKEPGKYEMTIPLSTSGKLNAVYYAGLPMGVWKMSITPENSSINFSSTYSLGSTNSFSQGGTVWSGNQFKDRETRGGSSAFGIVFFENIPTDTSVTITLEGEVHNSVSFNSSTGKYHCDDPGCTKVYENGQDLSELILGSFQCERFGNYGNITIVVEDNGDTTFMIVNGKKSETTVSCEGNNFVDPTTGVIYMEVISDDFGVVRADMLNFKPGVSMEGEVFVNGVSKGKTSFDISKK